MRAMPGREGRKDVRSVSSAQFDYEPNAALKTMDCRQHSWRLDVGVHACHLTQRNVAGEP